MPSHKWDMFFLGMAEYVSRISKDPSTKAGAVIARPDRTVASVGFNGFAKNMKDDPELYANREVKYSRIIHCEVNALIHSREPVRGCTLYTYPFMCCDRCVVQMLQAGIGRFVYPTPTADAVSRWGEAFKKTEAYMREAGVEFEEIWFPNVEAK